MASESKPVIVAPHAAGNGRTFSKILREIAASSRIAVRDAVLNSVAASVLLPRGVRCLIYRLVGMDVDTIGISARCFVGGPNISIGCGTHVNYGCFFDTLARISIGENCAIAMGVYLITSTDAIGTSSERAGALLGKSISIGNGCWIGARATVLPGVNIGEGCIVAPGSVITHDCQPNGLYAGNPARFIRRLE